MLKRISLLFNLGNDAASEDEIIEFIERGVNFRGAKLWILIIAVFVASLGLNTNSTAVIIGAMLISPVMGPIIGMGLGVGIYDFDLLRRSWRNFVIATLFSILTATIYFLLTPINVAQNELLARTSPTFYDVLIALCGGLAGIIAISSHSQRTGNVIPGVAIATALMPPLCTVGFGIATANWTYAAGAFYLFIINTIFIALATFIGAVFIMKFQKRTFVDRSREQKVKRIVYVISFITIIPALILTVSLVHKTYFEQRVSRFIQHELHFQMTHIISHRSDYPNRSFEVVMLGQEVDSTAIETARQRLSRYRLDGVDFQVIQGSQSENAEMLRHQLQDVSELHHAEHVISEQQSHIAQLEQRLLPHTQFEQLAPQLADEMKVLFPQVANIALAHGIIASTDSSQVQNLAVVTLNASLNNEGKESLTQWLKLRSGFDNLRLLFDRTNE